MSEKFDYYTIEPDREGGVNVYGHGVYGRESVLEGQDRRVFLDAFRTQEEAEIKYPNAATMDRSTRPRARMSETPPDWFDPSVAGEVWHEDDY